MLSGWRIAAFEAQAIAARTYVLYHKATYGLSRPYDVTATAASQVYGGVNTESWKSRTAVRNTRGVVLTYGKKGREKIFPTYYFSTCGGGTRPVDDVFPRSPDIPPLQGVDVDYCRGLSPYYNWGTVRISKSDLGRKLRKVGNEGRYPAFADFSKLVSVVADKTDNRGRLVRVSLKDDRGKTVTVSAEIFRIITGPSVLKSTWCRIEDARKEIHFVHGRGYGHGVGMCQYGAEGLARQGSSALSILRRFYPGSVPVRAY
jgi:stage II sporulation protein D